TAPDPSDRQSHCPDGHHHAQAPAPVGSPTRPTHPRSRSNDAAESADPVRTDPPHPPLWSERRATDPTARFQRGRATRARCATTAPTASETPADHSSERAPTP